MRFKKWILLFSILTVISCSKEESVVDESLPEIIPSGNEQYLRFDSDYIFDDDQLHTFNLVIDPDLYAIINSNPASEQYVEGMLIFEGDTISPVGIRYKGSIGGFVGCVSGSDWNNPSGQKICTKLSMKVKINWAGRTERFYGLKKLQFHSQNLDNSQMHERLGYYLFRQMGVPAPRSVHARLMINGEYSGLYALTEQIDGRFSRYHFDGGEGNVYKEVWPLTFRGTPNTTQAFLSALKTNEDDNPSVAIIENFANAIYNADETEIKEVIREYMDIDNIIALAVVDRMIRNDDGPFHWYCGGGGCSNHNYYWYEEPKKGKIHLIPWDLDNAFENIIANANPVTPIKDGWGETTNNCQPFNYGNFNFRQWSASCDKLTAAWASFQEEYDNLKKTFLEGPFREENVTMLLNKWADQIRNATSEASQVHNDAITISRWESAMRELETQLTFARNQ